MKTMIALAFTSLCVWTSAAAQTPPYLAKFETSATPHEDAPPLAITELEYGRETHNAWFPNFKGYVRDNVRYPNAARESGLEGVVYAEATVGTNGKLRNIRIVEGLSYSCDKEVVRLLSDMPAWNPARRNGEAYEQLVEVPVRFQLKPF